ncbi:hypothetical protein KZP23_15820 [Echinicola marina]|uniref:hypothetical protein n=1 Tax=Echinicola marina TaxID=2859768 RepID=UPI001CF641EA|nr:hypothetical protein [Echinicola marina]UCS92168.1 hypothetical protein KZP23_15820 [Echinicola marina]
MNKKNIIMFIAAIFIVIAGYGQNNVKVRDINIIGTDNIATVVKSSLNSIPHLKVGSVTGSFAYFSDYRQYGEDYEKTGTPYLVQYYAKGQLIIDNVEVTMPDGSVIRYTYNGKGLTTSHPMFPPGYYGHNFSRGLWIDGGSKSSISGSTNNFSQTVVMYNDVMSNPYIEDLGSESIDRMIKAGIDQISINCTAINVVSIGYWKEDVEWLRDAYSKKVNTQQNNNRITDNSNSINNQGNNNIRGNNANSYHLNTLNRNRQNNSYNNLNNTPERQNYNNISKQFNQLYQNKGAVEEEDGEREETGRERMIREEKERNERERIERDARLAEIKRKNNLAESRKNVLKHFPMGELPASATKVNSNMLFYFVYTGAYDFSEESPYIYLSNVFAIGQYPDGTWPMKTTIQEEISKLSEYSEYIHGYYTSEKEAQGALNNFRISMTSTGVRIKDISYPGKNTKVQQQNTSGNKQQTLDYWGNPVKRINATSPQKTQMQQQEKKEIKLDYWGNPIKE